MSAKSHLQRHLESILQSGESVAVTTVCQVKGGMKKQLGKSIAKGVAASLAVSAATGGASGLLVVAVPPSAWVVVTSHRLLLIERTNSGRGLGELVFDAPRKALTATMKRGLLNEVTISDASDGQSLLRLNLGVKKGAAQQIISAIER
jgi:hypothetical protein